MNKKAGLRGIILVITGLFLAGNVWSEDIDPDNPWVNVDGSYKCSGFNSKIPCPSIAEGNSYIFPTEDSYCCNGSGSGGCVYEKTVYAGSTGSCEQGNLQYHYDFYRSNTVQCKATNNSTMTTPVFEKINSQTVNATGLSCQGDCGTAGQKKYKYTADSGGCGYSTEINTCCANGYWSGFEAEGSAGTTCTSGAYACDSTTTCWNGSNCANKGSVSSSCTNFFPRSLGQATRSATCLLGLGWVYGSWDTSACHCNSDYHYVWATGHPSECVWECKKKNPNMNDNMEGGCRSGGGIWQYPTCACKCPRGNYYVYMKSAGIHTCVCYTEVKRDHVVNTSSSNWNYIKTPDYQNGYDTWDQLEAAYNQYDPVQNIGITLECGGSL